LSRRAQLAATDRIGRGCQSLQRDNAVDEAFCWVCAVEFGRHVISPGTVWQQTPANACDHATCCAKSHSRAFGAAPRTRPAGKQVRALRVPHVAVEESEVLLEYRMLPFMLPQVFECGRKAAGSRQETARYQSSRAGAIRAPCFRRKPADAAELG